MVRDPLTTTSVADKVLLVALLLAKQEAPDRTRLSAQMTNIDDYGYNDGYYTKFEPVR